MARKVVLFKPFTGSIGRYIDRPGQFIHDLVITIKRGWQRLVYGWDETAVWSLDGYLCDMLPPILDHIKRHGSTPGVFYDDIELAGNPEAAEEARRKHDEALDIMIEGFAAAKRIMSLGDGMPYDEWKEQEEEDFQKFDQGMEYFHKYFFTLWT